MTAPLRTYPVPRAVCATATPRITADAVYDTAIRSAKLGKVSSFHLPALAAGGWCSGRDWAQAVIAREGKARDRKRMTLLAAIGYDPDTYVYHGVMDPSYPEVELLTSVVRSTSAEDELEVWDGLGWGGFDLDEDDVVYAVMDESTLAELLDALSGGSGGLILRPTEPRAWLPPKSSVHVDQYDAIAAAATPTHTGAMVAFYPPPEVAAALSVGGGEPADEIHLTLAYLGDTEEEAIDYQAVQRAVARWARQVAPMSGEVSGRGVFTAGERPVAYASVDLPDLPQARESLVRLLELEGVPVKKDHGYTPHMTLAYSKQDPDVSAVPLSFDSVHAVYAGDRQEYPLGMPVIAAGGAGPGTLYAIVDEYDTGAVLDLVRVTAGPTAYRRKAGKWEVDKDMLLRLMGVDPPPVVEVNPEQATDVIAQVDAYDKDNPEKEPVTAAFGGGRKWDEKKYKRAGGKFASKNGANGSSSGGPKPSNPSPNAPKPPRGPSRPSGGGGTPSAANGSIFDNVPGSIAESGVGPEFFRAQPPGFEAWLKKFLAERKADSAKRSAAAKDGAASDDDPNDKASKTARDKATKAADEKAAGGGPEPGDDDYRPGWWDQVPEEFRGSMMSFLQAASNGGKDPAQQAKAGARRVAGEDQRDRDFDLRFAKEGLGESRRREFANQTLQGLKDRLVESGADPAAIARLMTAKVAEEKRAREEFARKRRLAVEQERVRRMEHRHAEKAKQDQQAGLTAASMMPDKLKSFWSKGEGAAKIRWGTGGDFDRCRRALTKYLKPEQVSGACANLHHLATGSWPGKGRKH